MTMKPEQEHEILSRLELIIALLRENNEILSTLLTNVRDDHKTNSSQIHGELKTAVESQSS
jgi:hypothetical protein